MKVVWNESKRKKEKEKHDKGHGTLEVEENKKNGKNFAIFIIKVEKIPTRMSDSQAIHLMGSLEPSMVV